mmetsp:Transcript_11585/g.24441  ORF Transcript_11585/g.24441 Transcript_11585/m.24441 type:complete len:301 (-) Transcript_11585:521-1423(-)
MTVPKGWNAFVSLHLHVKNEMIFVITVWVSSSLQLRSFVHPEGGSRRCRGRSSRVVIVIRFKSNRSGRRSARAEIGDVVGLLGGSTCSFSILRNGSISGTGSSSSRIDKEGSRGLGLALALVLAMTQFSRCGRRRHRAILRGGHGTGQPRPSSRHDPVVHVPSGVVVHPGQVRLVDARSDRGGSRRGRIEAVARDGQNLRDLHGLEVLLLLLLQLLLLFFLPPMKRREQTHVESRLFPAVIVIAIVVNFSTSRSISSPAIFAVKVDPFFFFFIVPNCIPKRFGDFFQPIRFFSRRRRRRM